MISQIESITRLEILPENAKWLEGEGAGCWFEIESVNDSTNLFLIKRFNMKGGQEFCLEFALENGVLDLNENFEFDYPSHAKKCTIIQGESRLSLKRMNA